MHRSWGPLEPFDDSMPALLREKGVYTHMISDHQHYWEDGGATYHHRYNTWEIVRGQEGDCWKASVKDPDIPEHLGRSWRQDCVNRSYMDEESKHPLAKVFDLGLEFLQANKDSDNWFLHWECFDPHEPFFTTEKYRSLYPDDYSGPQFDWPEYGMVTETEEDVQHCRKQYAALLTMCDTYLGKFIDFMDENNMWEDTMVIVNTDHGFLLGEHDCWAKSVHPWYNETAHIPLFVWDPRSRVCGQRRTALVQGIDIPATLLGLFEVDKPQHMQGHDLASTLVTDEPVRNYALFGLHGAHINITDGRYVYMRAPVENNQPLYNYTQMPMHMRTFFSLKEMRTMRLHQGFSFTKECPVMQISAMEDTSGDTSLKHGTGTMLFDLQQDPYQMSPIQDEEVESRMIKHMIELMKENDAPHEQYIRMGLDIS